MNTNSISTIESKLGAVGAQECKIDAYFYKTSYLHKIIGEINNALNSRNMGSKFLVVIHLPYTTLQIDIGDPKRT